MNRWLRVLLAALTFAGCGDDERRIACGRGGETCCVARTDAGAVRFSCEADHLCMEELAGDGPPRVCRAREEVVGCGVPGQMCCAGDGCRVGYLCATRGCWR